MPAKAQEKETRSERLQVAVTPSEKEWIEGEAIRRSRPGALVSASDLVRALVQGMISGRIKLPPA